MDSMFCVYVLCSYLLLSYDLVPVFGPFGFLFCFVFLVFCFWRFLRDNMKFGGYEIWGKEKNIIKIYCMEL